MSDIVEVKAESGFINLTEVKRTIRKPAKDTQEETLDRQVE